MTNTNGPDELRYLATLLGSVDLFGPESEQAANNLAAQWEADRAALERARALANKRAVSARNVAEWVRGLWADYCRQSGEAGVSVIMNQEILEKLKRARALIPEMVAECVQKRKYVPCGCGGDHCSYCTYSETWHKLAAELAEGGRP